MSLTPWPRLGEVLEQSGYRLGGRQAHPANSGILQEQE